MPEESEMSFDSTSATPTGDAVNEWLSNPKEYEDKQRTLRKKQAAQEEVDAAISQVTRIVNSEPVDDREKRLTVEELNEKAHGLTKGISEALERIEEYNHALKLQTDNFVRFTYGNYRYKVHLQNEGQVRLFRRVHEEHSHLTDKEEMRNEEIDPEYWDEELFVKCNNSNPHDLKHRPVIQYRMTQRFRRNIRPFATGEEASETTKSPKDIHQEISELFTHPLQNRDSGFAVYRAAVMLGGLQGNTYIPSTTQDH